MFKSLGLGGLGCELECGLLYGKLGFSMNGFWMFVEKVFCIELICFCMFGMGYEFMYFFRIFMWCVKYFLVFEFRFGFGDVKVICM